MFIVKGISPLQSLQYMAKTEVYRGDFFRESDPGIKPVLRGRKKIIFPTKVPKDKWDLALGGQDMF